ncbi:LysR family transcriptional regulator [Nocardioides conyzicola]|uniref:LysR family transcriptional regulator n=1 Tax=Nocardioides conyzicola TaxID=1651781 RepID=A0ABP8X8M7_9ACTN
MDVRALEYFVAVAEELNVTRAAARVHAAQSTVSASLRSLERELGATLFERTTRSMRLTASGERVLPAAREAVAAVDRARDLARERSAGLRGRVRLGTFSSLDLIDLPTALAAFRARHPAVELNLSVAASGSSGLQDDLLRGRLDLALFSPPSDPGLRTHRLLGLPFRAFLPTGHRLAGRRRLRLADLTDEDWVDTPLGFGNRTMLDEQLRRAGISRRIVVESGDLPSAIAFVRAGLGVGVLPATGAVDGCVQLPVVDGPPDWELHLAVRRTPAPGAAARALLAALREHATARTVG